MITVKERPINLRAWEVQAILDGRKTELRRKVSEQTVRLFRDFNEDGDSRPGFKFGPYRREDGYLIGPEWLVYAPSHAGEGVIPIGQCPYGRPGDRLWGREAWGVWFRKYHNDNRFEGITYRSDTPDKTGRRTFYKTGQHGDAKGYRSGWKPSECMPRWASRILQEITNVRVQRLQDISEADAIAEGCHGGHGAIPGYAYGSTPLEDFWNLWISIHGADSWERNDFVWAVTFKRVDQ